MLLRGEVAVIPGEAAVVAIRVAAVEHISEAVAALILGAVVVRILQRLAQVVEAVRTSPLMPRLTSAEEVAHVSLLGSHTGRLTLVRLSVPLFTVLLVRLIIWQRIIWRRTIMLWRTTQHSAT